jgi:hypothetical protein
MFVFVAAGLTLRGLAAHNVSPAGFFLDEETVSHFLFGYWTRPVRLGG